MNSHDWYVEHRAEFATRTLDPADEALFLDHLVRCEECQAAVRVMEKELGWLGMGASPVTPRPGLRRQIVRSVLGERPPVWQRWLVPVALAASALIAVGGYLPQHRVALRLADSLAARTTELSALRDSLSIMHKAAKVLQASIPMDGREGGMLIFADETSHRWNVVVHGLPPAPPGETYQFWFILSDGMVRGATVTSDPSRPVFLTLGMPKEGGTVMGAALTMEPKDNAGHDPKGKMLAHLML